MERPSLQLSLAGMLGLVACVALNIWLFRLGTLLGIIGLNITKHVVIAYLCQVLGVDKRRGPRPRPPPGRRTAAGFPAALRRRPTPADRARRRSRRDFVWAADAPGG